MKQFKISVFFVSLVLLHIQLDAQRIATLEVKHAKQNNGTNVAMQISLNGVTFLPDSSLQLVEVRGKSLVPVAYQVDQSSRTLSWIMDGSDPGKKTYELRKAKPSINQSAVKTVINNSTLTISRNDKNLLRYNYNMVYPPAGIDTVYRRSGFIHPLWAPRGQELTRTQPPDHYHHFGLWNAWTQVLYQKDTFDLWNLVLKQGTVRFVRFLSVTEGPIYAEYKVLLEHVIFPKDKEEKVVLNEVQTVRVYPPAKDQNYYTLDVMMEMNGATDDPVQLLRYRYGGLGIRTTGEWDRNNSMILTSEGKNRKEADSTTARWCIVQGSLGKDYGGFLMMSHPGNYNHPEPIRVWPETMYNRGDVFVNFSPIKTKGWLLEPRKTYVLKYRFVLFNDKISKEKAESSWHSYVQPPEITIRKEKQL